MANKFVETRNCQQRLRKTIFLSTGEMKLSLGSHSRSLKIPTQQKLPSLPRRAVLTKNLRLLGGFPILLDAGIPSSAVKARMKKKTNKYGIVRV